MRGFVSRCGGDRCAVVDAKGKPESMDQELQNRLTASAQYLLKNGISVMPIDMTSKKPAIEWKALIDKPMQPEQWTYTGCNVGLITGMTSGYVVVDCDSEESYTGWLRNMPATRLRIRTKRG